MAQPKNDSSAAAEAVLALLANPEALQQALTALGQAQTASQRPKTRGTVKVRVNTTDGARKFGDITIVKVKPNGYETPAAGVWADQIPGLIDALTAAQEAIAERS